MQTEPAISVGLRLCAYQQCFGQLQEFLSLCLGCLEHEEIALSFDRKDWTCRVQCLHREFERTKYNRTHFEGSLSIKGFSAEKESQIDLDQNLSLAMNKTQLR